MSAQQEQNDSDCEEINLAELWGKFKPVFVKYKYWMLLSPILFAFIGLGLSEIVTPQWEVVTTLQVGRVSSSDLIESLDAIVFRLKMENFQQSVLGKCDIPLNSSEADLYKKSISAKPLISTGMIEMKVRGFSRESTLKLSSATVGEIRNIQSKIILQAFVVPKRRLVAIEKFNNDIEAIVKQPRQLSSENQSLTNIAATYLMYQSEQDKAALLNQVAYPGLHPTVVVSEVSSLDPIYPQKYVWVLIYSVVGLLLGIVVLWIINSLNT